MAPPCPSNDQSAEPLRLSLRALRTLPARICSPPPAVGKAKSWGVTPLYQVKLEDVLDNKHLPPLSLRDFEQHLLFVIGSPEYLYFALWLKEYTRRYHEWSSDAKPRFNSFFKGVHPTSLGSPSLASFFSKAQHTFIIPGSEYALDAPADVLAPLASCDNKRGVWTSRYGPHPDPAVFTELSLIVNSRLKTALDHCVVAAYTNVGNGRALCGIVVGGFMTLAGTIAPVTLNFVHRVNRWERLAALPGLLIGLTIVLAAWNGVCIMIWIFGDFRQLRKYEMGHPTETMASPFSPFRFPDASAPTAHPIVTPPRVVARSTKLATTPRFRPSLPPISQADDTRTLPGLVRMDSISSLASPVTPAHTSFPSPPPQLRVQSLGLDSARTLSPISFDCPISSSTPSAHCDKQSVCPSVDSDASDDTNWTGDDPIIEVSEAYYDELLEPIAGSNAVPRSIAVPLSAMHDDGNIPLTGPSHLPTSTPSHHPTYQTASFIRPYIYSPPAPTDLEHGPSAQTNIQPPFDFNGLPRRAGGWNEAKEAKRTSVVDSIASENAWQNHSSNPRRHSATSVVAPSVTSSYWPAVDLSVFSSDESDTRPPMTSGNSTSRMPELASTDEGFRPVSLNASEALAVASRMRDMLSVPAFRSPLTLIFNPIVCRAQREIVVRSAMIALIVGLLAEVVLIAIP